MKLEDLTIAEPGCSGRSRVPAAELRAVSAHPATPRELRCETPTAPAPTGLRPRLVKGHCEPPSPCPAINSAPDVILILPWKPKAARDVYPTQRNADYWKFHLGFGAVRPTHAKWECQ